jgi:hypothetical protein
MKHAPGRTYLYPSLYIMGVGIFGVATFMWRPLLEAMK